ncbi:hypothetical protein GCM10028820_17170 [Tessaracoccus terricola]
MVWDDIEHLLGIRTFKPRKIWEQFTVVHKQLRVSDVVVPVPLDRKVVHCRLGANCSDRRNDGKFTIPLCYLITHFEVTNSDPAFISNIERVIVCRRDLDPASRKGLSDSLCKWPWLQLRPRRSP